ncbi:hypothetical protein HBH56_037040 [Parastagonospora nodorum]|uniref:Uncharacterized protein n=1 Tax=Phaeosphaeria nodorum (strain SN15 / ATCC MYA-4574 / FGSC 10173) TaxID=321614 RepID=A0A7U2F7V5_PHANO|nr:hypothetical protein HBH56_037040 [Parastagonospora nodorum]QRC99982.1 hypothetical protein JI435_437770 [Parastagonospora nodorum SN15]KAH3933551.1 hypothetical protein HBH54_062430 [Parastagonospora nodorum]KAH4001896.1 hypothetical protein HBI10_079400 [Parastagonospora nodorum]KAH4032004.1 hypothetical protein HBI13_018800 [Parastagonospora nodorum]
MAAVFLRIHQQSNFGSYILIRRQTSRNTIDPQLRWKETGLQQQTGYAMPVWISFVVDNLFTSMKSTPDISSTEEICTLYATTSSRETNRCTTLTSSLTIISASNSHAMILGDSK